jgi:hypothetical protein
MGGFALPDLSNIGLLTSFGRGILRLESKKDMNYCVL